MTSPGRASFIGMGIVSIALAVCLSCSPALAQQQQQDQQQAPPDQPSVAAEQQPPQNNPAPPPAVQGAPPRAAQGAPPLYLPVAPPTLTLPEGTLTSVRMLGQISSDKNQVGDRFSASLDQPLVANGYVVARRGQIVSGRVIVAKKAVRGGSSQLGVQAIELTTVDGQILPINTQLTQSSARTPPGRNASIIAATTGIGAIIGGAAGGGVGAAIGAGVGVSAGAATVLSTRGRPTVIYPEQLLSFRLQAPLTISTERGQAAFQPINQSDYSRGDQDAYGRPRFGGPYYPGPGPAYYAAGPYPYPYWYGWGFPVVPYVGFYGVYGPRFYGGVGGFRR